MAITAPCVDRTIARSTIADSPIANSPIANSAAPLDDTRSRVTLRPVGEIDAGTVGDLSHLVHDALLSGAHEIDLDLREVTFMDTAAVEVLQMARETLETSGGFLCVRNAAASVRRLLSLTAFTPGRPAAHR